MVMCVYCSSNVLCMCMQAVDAVLAEAPCDTQVLSVLEYVLQQLKRSADYSQAIMAASNAQPKDPELMRALFDLYLKYDNSSCMC